MTITNIPDIITAIAECKNFAELEEIRKALDAKTGEIKAAVIAQAEAMGLACHDGNGKPRKRRATAHKDAD